MSLPDVPLSNEAYKLLQKIRPRIRERLDEVNHVPVGVLLWGPGIEAINPLADVRSRLRSDLRANGHAAVFSEELCESDSCYSLRLQELAQAQEFDLIVCLPCTAGSLGEVHDFAVDRRVHAKLLIFLNRLHQAGYSPQSIQVVSTIFSSHVEYYPSENDTDIIMERTMEHVQRIRELKYIMLGRY